jgi:hypothetical protein
VGSCFNLPLRAARTYGVAPNDDGQQVDLQRDQIHLARKLRGEPGTVKPDFTAIAEPLFLFGLDASAAPLHVSGT